jgi:hypothetical protein
MRQLQYIGFLLIAIVLLLLLAVFPVLTIDAIGRLIARIRGLEPANFILVLYLELSRAFTTVVALLAALSLVIRSSRAADSRALALFLIFSALTYEKIFGTTGYPGPLQSKLTISLLNLGVDSSTLVWLFGPVPWSVWLALAAALRFSVVFPRPPLSAEAIDESGRHDRRGALRGAGLAGLDIGAAFRTIAKSGLRAGVFRPLPLWTAALVMTAITTVISDSARLILFATAASLVTALAITNLRASYNVVAETEKARMRWLILGFSIGGALFLIAALPLLFFNNTFATVPALVLLMLAPAIIVVCMALGVLYTGPVDAREPLRLVPGHGALVMMIVMVFAVATTLLTGLADRIDMGRGLALLGAVLLTALLVAPLRKVTQRLVNRVLERPGADVLS